MLGAITIRPTLLNNGQVLIVGGGAHLASTELYNPATGKFSLAANLNTGSTDHRAVLLGKRRSDGCGRLRWEWGQHWVPVKR